MKRIVQCPKCETKLSVFDSGKPISQKCPKCTNTFEVKPEGAVEPPAPEAQTTPSPAPAADAPVKEKPAPAPMTQKPSAPAASALPPEPIIVESGSSLRHVFVIVVLLVIILAVQVWSFKQAQARFNRLDKQVYDLATQVQKLKINQ